MSIRYWDKFFKKHSFDVMVGISIIFFIALLFFYKPISKWLKGKQDFYINQPLKTIKSSTIITKKNETKCRNIFESIFQRPFPSVRPSFLKRSNGYALELDGYNKDLNLAFEYNGAQHYKFSSRFHKTIKDFEDQVKRDQDKRIMCQKAKVTVIEIPYTVTYPKLEFFIRTKLRNRGLI